jgi:hypothetical protein
MSDDIMVPSEVLEHLVYMAEEAVYLQQTEFSNHPTQDDENALTVAWALLYKPMPEYFSRCLRWSNEAGQQG